MSDPLDKLIIISGPSGAGKSTVVRELLKVSPVPLKLSVSATTRARRRGEEDGVDYHFLSHEEFRRRRERGEFLECKEVYGGGEWYGTLRSEVTSGHATGKWVLLEIDVCGALTVLEQVPRAVTIFIDTGSMIELEKRLRKRGTETSESLARRLSVAAREMKYRHKYQYHVINDSVPRAVAELCGILQRIGERPNAG
ncbi:MAG: guanylate kinase [Pirellulaceae bacterium]